MIFLPHTNTVILLEPYCGTITEPGLPVLRGHEGERNNCVSKIQIDGQKYQDKTTLAS